MLFFSTSPFIIILMSPTMSIFSIFRCIIFIHFPIVLFSIFHIVFPIVFHFSPPPPAWSSGVQTLSWSLSNVDSRCAEARRRRESTAASKVTVFFSLVCKASKKDSEVNVWKYIYISLCVHVFVYIYKYVDYVYIIIFK